MEYAYTALDNDGNKVKGFVTANDSQGARSIIIAQKLDIISFKKKVKSGFSLFQKKVKLTSREIISILLNIGELDKIGMPMIHIIEILKDDIASGSNMKSFCKRIYNSVKSGSTLGDAFEKQTGSIDPVYANFIKIGEDTGNYHDIFAKVIEYIKWADKISRAVNTILFKATTSILFIIILMVTISVVIIPKTMSFVKDNGMSIPWYTQSLVDMSNFIVHKYYYFLAILFVVYTLFKVLMKFSYLMQSRIDLLKLKLPILGDLIINIEAARFVTFFSIMYECGIRIEIIFAKVKDIVKNKHIKNKIRKIEMMVLNGSLPQEAMAAVAPFPKHVIKMMAIGFESGNIKDVMGNTKYFLDRDIEERTDLLVSSIKPMILVFTGFLVGWMAIAVFGPIYSNLGNFSDTTSTVSTTNTNENG